MGVPLLRLHVDGFVVVLVIDDHREKELLRTGVGKARVPVGAPLHRRANPVAVAQIDVVAHAQLVPVVEDRGPGQREQQTVEQLDAAAVVLHQRRQPPADPEVDAGLGISRVDAIHVSAFLLGDHFQRQLVVVSQEEHPLTDVGNGGHLLESIDDRKTVFHVNGDEDPRHQRKMKSRVTFVARAEVLHGVFGPLVGLGQQHPPLEPRIDVGPQFFEEGVRFGQVLATGPLALEEIRHGVQTHSVHTHAEPVVHDLQHGFADFRIVEVQVGLVVIEAVPEIGPGDGIPGPVGLLEVLEDDPRVAVAIGGLAPDVEIPPAAASFRGPRAAEPGVLIRGVIEYQLGDHPQPALVRLAEEGAKIVQRSVFRVYAVIVGDVVAVVPPGRRIERQEPDRGDPEVLKIVEFAGQAAEIADPVVVRVVKRADVKLIDDGILVPKRTGVLHRRDPSWLMCTPFDRWACRRRQDRPRSGLNSQTPRSRFNPQPTVWTGGPENRFAIFSNPTNVCKSCARLFRPWRPGRFSPRRFRASPAPPRIASRRRGT